MVAKVYGVWSDPNKPSFMDSVMLGMQQTRSSLETAITKNCEDMNAHLLILGMIALSFSQTLLAGESPSVEGTWSVVSVEYAGRPVAALEGALLTLTGGKKTFKLPSGVVEQGTYTLDAAREPQRIDATTAGRSETARGIYSLEGDTLRMCLSQLGTRRPTEFATKMGSDLILMVLKRDPAKTAPPPPPASSCKPASSTEPVTLPKLTGTRHFRMGFTGFPHDFTLPAVSEARQFSRENADIIAHHIEGVPWAEALEDRPFSKEMTDEWKGKKAATPPGGKVYLAVSPGRGGLKVAEKGLPLPPELKGKAYDDPLVKRAFLDYCRRGIDFFRPDYLAIGIEVNEIHAAGADKWRAYVELHDYVYGELKKEHKNLPIFASFTLHGMLNARGKARDEMLAAYQQIMPHNDVVAVSFYPFIAGGTTDIAGALDWLTTHFDKFHKPYAVVETGEAADRLTFPTSGQVIPGTPAKQLAYYQQLLAFARARRLEFVISFLHRDYDALWDKIKATAPEAFMAWRDCGLLDETGAPRPARRVWQQYFALPLDSP